MAQVNKISSFKSFTEVKNQEATMKLRETNNAKRQETVGKIGSILDEMGLTSLSELDEEKKQALINKMFGNVSEDEAEDIEDEINKLGEPKKLDEGNAFGDAVRKAKEAGEKEFEFDGKTYKVEEGNAFGDSVRKAKEDGEEEFEFDGKTFKVEEAKRTKFTGKTAHDLYAQTGGKSVEVFVKNDWYSVDPKELKDDKCEYFTGYSRDGSDYEFYLKDIDFIQESLNEGRTISKIQYDWSKLTTTMAATAQNWKAAEGSAKEMLLGKLKEMTAQKKAIEAELDAAIADKDKDLELVVTEAFYRLPKDVVGTELYTANQYMQSLYSRIAAGNDVDPKSIDEIIKLLQQVKSLTKKFNKADEVTGTVYEGEVNEAEKFKSTKDFLDFCEEIDGMPENRIKRIMGKDYIDTPGGFRDEADDYDNDIEDYMISNMGKSDFEALKTWWQNNVQESTVTESGFHRSAPSAEATRKAEQLKKLKKLRDHNEETDRIKKAQLKRAKAAGSAKESVVNEAEVKSDDEFKEYAMTVLKKAFGDDFDEAKAGEVVDGILKKCGDDYGAAVGMLTSSLGESVVTNEAFDADKRVAKLAKLLKKQKFIGSVYPEGDTIKVFVDSGDVGTTMMWDDDEPGKVRMECEDDSYSETIDDNDDVVLNFFSNLDDSVDESVTNEAFDANYWEDYHDKASKMKNLNDPNSRQLQQEVSACVEDWNDNNEMGKENEVTPAGEKKVLKLAKEFVKAKGYICSDIIDAMIAQES